MSAKRRTEKPESILQDILDKITNEAVPPFVDVINRADRLLGIIYGSQGSQLLQRALTYELLVQICHSGTEIDPRDIRALTSSDVVDVSDDWTRQVGQVDLARVLGSALSVTNPMITGVYDNLGNRMPTMDASARAGYVDAIDRWARQLGQVDLARVLGGALTSANPVITGVYDAAGNRMPSMDATARPGYIDVIDRAARLLGVIYGNQGQLAQRAATLDTYVQLRNDGAEIDPRQVQYNIECVVFNIDEVDYTWNADGTLNTEVYKKGGGTVFTLTYTWNADGTLNKVVRT